MGDDQQQPQEDIDPIQQMIQQAMGSQKDQSAPDNYVMASAEPMERPSLGTRIGEKQTPAMIKPAAVQPATPASTPHWLGAPPDDYENQNQPKLTPPAVGSNNPERVALLKQQGEFATPLNKNDPKYKMGWGQRLLGIAANFGSGLNHQGPVAYTGPGATNSRYSRDEDTRQANFAKVGTQLEGQEKQDTENLKLYDTAANVQSNQTKNQVSQMKADVAQQLADIKSSATDNQAKYNEERTNAALAKIEETSRRNDQMFALGKGNLDLKQQLGDVTAQFRQQKLDADREKFTSGTDQKSLEAERKQRITAIENDYKGTWGKLTHPGSLLGGKTKEDEIKVVNDDIDAKLQKSGIGSGQPPAAGGAPATAPKVATQQHIAQYAKAKGIPVQQATKEFQKSGYKIQ